MKNIELLKKVADLVGFQFSKHAFAEAALEGGVVITNSTEGDFLVGDSISIKNDDGTFTIVGAGVHNLGDGRVFTTDAEGMLTEIKEAVEAAKPVMMEEIAVEVEDSVADVMSPDVVEAVIEALTPIVEELKVIAEEMKSLKKDYNEFKKTATHEPIKQDKMAIQNFSDYRYEILKAMKQKH